MVKGHKMNLLNKLKNSPSLSLILIFGLVSLLGDVTYEGARGVVGPYMATLGASAAVVGFVAGLGEFLGYGLRLISGYLTDRTGFVWMLTIIGYLMIFFLSPYLVSQTPGKLQQLLLY